MEHQLRRQCKAGSGAQVISRHHRPAQTLAVACHVENSDAVLQLQFQPRANSCLSLRNNRIEAVYYDVLKVVDALVWRNAESTYRFYCFVLSRYLTQAFRDLLLL
jgi:hypothetical protein